MSTDPGGRRRADASVRRTRGVEGAEPARARASDAAHPSADGPDAAGRPSGARRRPSRGGFGATVAIAVGVLAALALGGAAATNATGPRVTAIDVDPAAAAASGARLIVTTTTSLAEVDASQVTVTPATPFAVDTSGRSVGVRFTLPLYDDTEYTVRIDGLEAIGGGPATTATESFRTPTLDVYTLQRGTADGDIVVRTPLDGGDPVVVFTHPHIEDFRATATHLVISVRTENDRAALIVTGPDGGGARELPLPGDGFVTNLQSADRGDVIGYTFSDATLSDAGGRDTQLFTASLKASAAETDPVPITIPGNDPSVSSWGFVPDTDTLLVLTFDGRLSLVSATGGDPVALGAANFIDGIARGSGQAVIERVDGVFVIDLADGSDAPLVEPATDLGRQGRTTPLPGDGAGTVRLFTRLADAITPLDTDLVRVADDGSSTPLLTVDIADGVIQTCISPSGRYAAVAVAPDAIDNPRDGYLLPLPETVETRIVTVSDGTAVATVPGSMISWCRTPPGL